MVLRTKCVFQHQTFANGWSQIKHNYMNNCHTREDRDPQLLVGIIFYLT